VLSPPLRGERYLAGDGCCDSTLHIRALLPINGRLRVAQRFAIDWEQLDEQGRIYAGEPTDVNSYTIYGQKVHAAADARVVSVLNDQPQQVPGALPENLPLGEADGNSVVLDLGDGRFGFYAHMQPGSVRVKKGDKVRRGQVLGLVGNSGNTLAPHVHFHVMDGPSPIDSNGLPYLMDRFSVSERGVSTEAFGAAETMGVPLEVEPVQYPGTHRNELPLDLSVATFR
jgi:murein DD-endopeptidase MepM/ murein hydrolase activator NlpD